MPTCQRFSNLFCFSHVVCQVVMYDDLVSSNTSLFDCVKFPDDYGTYTSCNHQLQNVNIATCISCPSTTESGVFTIAQFDQSVCRLRLWRGTDGLSAESLCDMDKAAEDGDHPIERPAQLDTNGSIWSSESVYKSPLNIAKHKMAVCTKSV